METADKEELDGEVTLALLEKALPAWNRGEWACLCCSLAFPICARPSLAQFSGQNLLGRSSVWSPLLHEVLRPKELHEPVQLVPGITCPSPSVPGKLTADIPEGWESFCF